MRECILTHFLASLTTSRRPASDMNRHGILVRMCRSSISQKPAFSDEGFAPVFCVQRRNDGAATTENIFPKYFQWSPRYSYVHFCLILRRIMVSWFHD